MCYNFIKILFFISLFFIENDYLFSQKNSLQINKFNKPVVNDSNLTPLISEILLSKLNDYHAKHNLDSLFLNPVLVKAAENQAKYMSLNNEASLEQKGKYPTTADRLIFYGGSSYGDEIVLKLQLKKEKDVPTYDQIADDIAFKLLTDKKYLAYTENPKYNFTGIGTAIDEGMKKIFISVIFGNYRSLNSYLVKNGEPNSLFSTDQFKLQPYDSKICKYSDNFKNIEELQKGLFVKNNKIYFRYDNVKKLRKIIKNPDDGLSVDIVQKSQYPCAGNNIYDNNLVNKGIMIKRLMEKKIFDKNLLSESKGNRNKIEILIGDFPENIGNNYELNLLIIQDKCVCKNIFKTYLDEGNFKYSQKIDFVADTITFGNQGYSPKAEKGKISFKIPFEKNKTEYDRKDIEPVFKSFNVPEFIVDQISIIAYSSIEGIEDVNLKLQQKRAESIVNAIKKRQKNALVSKISTADNWEDFKRDVKKTEFEFLAKMTLEKAQEYIKEYQIKNRLEPVLKDERYAQIDMDITYDIEGTRKEQQYVVDRFNKAIVNNDLITALLIQKFIFKKILAGLYDTSAVYGQVIPENSKTAGMLMNKLWLDMYFNNYNSDKDYCSDVNKLYQLNPKNLYITFNNLYCRILNHEINDNMQVKIDSLYSSTFSKETVDLLNLEYQFMKLRVTDTLPNSEILVKDILGKIKAIVNVDVTNSQNALKLCKIYIKHYDYDYAIKLIEPFIYSQNIPEDLIFTFITLCSYIPYRIWSNKFLHATDVAYKMNPAKYCDLFKGNKMSFQVFDNTEVKNKYCKYCK
jgi:hypothetical protein